ncbi:hypothetical protein PHYSODRAFT_321586 [Phytophthora sojae]|uniref:Uncharacterized protein n=1 Tax=Phytophthora sojae (strain P6497) TaxID=1094619 RepID=G4YM61_PHYSP|nr:hypothetical protein PHYSODRAFT_321586 [Phytophthora sojae]EGZ27869.1 hypothetical protein PHYSODRAFT_321586 [Phytophthora sojae]|eukprot:XP_009515144.1 hypothetical protein PHYSODRAFT_321586 [Phytophthora sojae]
MEKPRRNPARAARAKRQKRGIDVAVPDNSAVNRFIYVLDLGTASVWEYLDPQSVSNTVQACPDVFSQDFIDSVSLRAVEYFAVENKTHLGRHCECDWMRRLDFQYQSDDRCKGAVPFTVDRSLPILQLAGGPKALLDALLLTKKLMQPFEQAERCRDAAFVPMVCPLVTKENPKVPTRAAVTRAIDRISAGAGARFFYKFKLNSQPSFVDYIEEHWSGISGSSCHYCDSLTGPDARKPKKYAGLTSTEIKRVRENCTKLYQPLKAALEENLRFVRFVRRPRRRSRREWSFTGKYKGLVAGISQGDVLCGLFLVSGFWPHE